MAKVKRVFVCRQCGAESPKWIGKCPVCGEWNTYFEEIVQKEPSLLSDPYGLRPISSEPKTLSEIDVTELPRLQTGEEELDRVLGGGIVPGSVVLIGGEPGIGKSTLILQTVLHMKKQQVLYVSGEESLQQLKLRAERIGNSQSKAWFMSELSLDEIIRQATRLKPNLLIIDSIQTVAGESTESFPGSITQVRDSAATLIQYAKSSGTPVILIGHINKEGNLAGPKVLEHMVDTVLLFVEGERSFFYRMLRPVKNWFGSTSEVGIYEMKQDGLHAVTNPSELLITPHLTDLSGVSIAAAVEGVRPFLIEVQALVSTAAYGMPQRSSTGFDLRRLNMLLAVLEKRAGFKLAQKDVFLNLAGGIKVNDTAIDLAVLASILSSSLDIPVGKKTCLTGEVGLSGEIRPVGRIEQRLAEAKKMGFHRVILPKMNQSSYSNLFSDLEIHQVSKVDEAFRLLFT